MFGTRSHEAEGRQKDQDRCSMVLVVMGNMLEKVFQWTTRIGRWQNLVVSGVNPNAFRVQKTNEFIRQRTSQIT